MKLINFKEVTEDFCGKFITEWHINPAHIIAVRTNPNAWNKFSKYYVVISGRNIPVNAETAERILKELKEL